MSVADLLPWLNLLLPFILLALWHAATNLATIKTWMEAHDKLDEIRFAEIERRLLGVEKSLPYVQKRHNDPLDF